ncbi:MAG: TolC family protein [Bacteroidota bacterium]|nr:TolC family protein [Bacteroidota bacterium]
MKTTAYFWLLFVFSPAMVSAQQADSIPVITQATLENCIQYALKYNPGLQNSKINEDITETIIKSKLADWYPQVNFTYNLQHNFKLPTFNFNGNLAHSGTYNTSGANFGFTQNIFNRDALLASRTSTDIRLAASQNTKEQKINLAAMVSKAFYDLILTEQQLKVTDEDIARNEQSLKDAFYQYQSGIVDKTDYKRATIALNNAKAQRKYSEESYKAKSAYLKELMGYSYLNNFILEYDTTQMENEIYLDTSENINYNNRIEVQQLETQKKLQQYNLQYYKWSFLPNLSAFGNYNLNFLNNQFSKLYNNIYPNSFAGLTLSIPIFQGGKRIQQIKEAQFQVAQVDNDLRSLQNNINTQYENAMANYKSNLFNFLSLKDNLSLAGEVYDVIRLQYRSGVKAYLDVITAESDLRTAQINYYNALYQVLSSKIDVMKSLGNIKY